MVKTVLKAVAAVAVVATAVSAGAVVGSRLSRDDPGPCLDTAICSYGTPEGTVVVLGAVAVGVTAAALLGLFARHRVRRGRGMEGTPVTGKR